MARFWFYFYEDLLRLNITAMLLSMSLRRVMPYVWLEKKLNLKSPALLCLLYTVIQQL